MSPDTASKITTDHEAIRGWAEARGARPALKSDDDREAGAVRLDFARSRANPELPQISWEEWFAGFDRSKLALLYQEQTACGELSNFCKLVRREKADEVASAVGGRGRSAARKKAPRRRTSEPVRPTRKSSGGRPRSPGEHSSDAETSTA
jgi:hypothetical protein